MGESSWAILSLTPTPLQQSWRGELIATGAVRNKHMCAILSLRMSRELPERPKGERLASLHQRAVEMRKKPTWAEKKLWVALRNEHLDGYKFRRQHRIGRYLPDLYCFAARL